jgi:hypothetical protein
VTEVLFRTIIGKRGEDVSGTVGVSGIVFHAFEFFHCILVYDAMIGLKPDYEYIHSRTQILSCALSSFVVGVMRCLRRCSPAGGTHLKSRTKNMHGN